MLSVILEAGLLARLRSRELVSAEITDKVQWENGRLIMATSIAEKLEKTRLYLDELGRFVDGLESTYPSVFEDPELRSNLASLQSAQRVAQNRLANPALSIAMIGTTSAGKSTIVNALIGRRIAPMEAAEMSAGVLTLRHATERRLKIDFAEGAPWEAGTWIGISDSEVYVRVREGVMKPYHAERKTRVCLAPQILAEGPLLPSVYPDLLGLPPGLAVEFIDLPGLKSVQDQENLKVIQSRVHKAFSLVALDYHQTDEEHRKKLLEELKEVVKYSQGRTDSMLFVLNRVDGRGRDDEPIEVRINALKREIMDVLQLPSEPDVLPFEARILYRAQCAWGAADSSAPVTSKDIQLEHLKAMFEECASSLKRYTNEYPEVREWIRGIEDNVDDRDILSASDLRKLLDLAEEISGGKELWKRLRVRVEESFSELVILPSLFEVLKSSQSLRDNLKSVSEIRKIDSREKLDMERNRLEDLQQRLHIEVGTASERFQKELNDAIEGLKSRDQNFRADLTKKLGEGFEELLNAVNDVTGDLTRSLIAPVRDALKERRGVYELEEQLNKVLSPSLAHDLAEAYNLFERHIPSLTHSQDRLSIKLSETDSSATKDAHKIERDALRLYQKMRESMTSRAKFTLQGKAESIRGALTGLLEEQGKKIYFLCLSELPDFSLSQAVESAWKASSRDDLLDLPEDFFTLPKAVHQSRHDVEEVVGQEQQIEEYSTGTCFKATKTRTVSKDVMGKVTYLEIKLPDEDEMAKHWSDGVSSGEDSLWNTLSKWMIDTLKESSNKFSISIDSVLRLADRTLEQQQRLVQDEFQNMAKLWERIDNEVEQMDLMHNKLNSVAISKRM